jgi:hypothetical protein
MKIIIEGNLVDTKDIWDISLDESSRHITIKVKLIDKDPIIISRDIAYDRSSMNVASDKAPYERLYKEIKEQWEQDKMDIKVFKI